MADSQILKALSQPEKKRPPGFNQQLTPTRIKNLRAQQAARWRRPGVGTDPQGNPY